MSFKPVHPIEFDYAPARNPATASSKREALIQLSVGICARTRPPPKAAAIIALQGLVRRP